MVTQLEAWESGATTRWTGRPATGIAANQLDSIAA